MSWFKRKPKEEEKEKSLEEVQREYYERGIEFYNLPNDIANVAFWTGVVLLVGLGGLLGVGYVADELSGVERVPVRYPTPFYPVVDAIITGEDADCIWVALIDEDGGWRGSAFRRIKRRLVMSGKRLIYRMKR